MNCEQLKRVNELVERLNKINRFLQCRYNQCDIREHKCAPEHADPVDWGVYYAITIDRKVIEPALIVYRDELKAELKELGYEE